ncbi:MFS transporter [Humibacillus sp. DSM 29435]|uniref:MFS transporter n=1 Tax=Humibacillus sp. DSM 29435 TaxID=1869167 RepID=UPI0008724ED7|nr:MFS transporter [Humibacillus sp. DSM 29435]OFE18934.1 MFS transporter [Humibacillus sp. DSM 29435]
MATTTAGRREWIALGVLCLPLLMVSMDVSVLFFAVPHISESLQPSATQVLWIFDVYGFVLAGLLLTMGSVADRIGRRRLLLLGALAFAAASVLAAYSGSAEQLIAARALLGVGGATLMPSTLAIVRTLFVDPVGRAKAIGVWSAVMAGGVGVGPVVSGILLAHFWWGSVFLINVPAMVVLLAVAPFLLPESRSAAAKVDLFSSVLSLAAIFPVVHAIKQGATSGLSWTVVLYALGGTFVGVLFVRRQRHLKAPMVDLRLFAQRGFSGSVTVQMVAMFGLMGNAVLMTQYLQSVLGFTALTAALWSLLPSVFVGAAAPTAVALAARLGRPIVMASGFVVAAAGFIGLQVAGAHSSILPALVCASFVAVGLVSVATLVTEYAVGVAPPERTGAVSALFETAGELGGALGLAVLGSVLSAVYAARVVPLLPLGLTPGQLAAATQTLGDAGVIAADVTARAGGGVGQQVLDAARTAYVAGMHTTGLVAASVLLVGAVVAATTLPRVAAGVSMPEQPQPASSKETDQLGPARADRP